MFLKEGGEERSFDSHLCSAEILVLFRKCRIQA